MRILKCDRCGVEEKLIVDTSCSIREVWILEGKDDCSERRELCPDCREKVYEVFMEKFLTEDK